MTNNKCKWSSGGADILEMIILMGRPIANNHFEGQASFKWSLRGTGLLQMIIRRGRALANPQLRAILGLNSLCCNLYFSKSNSIVKKRVVLVVVHDTLIISERNNSTNYSLGTAIWNSHIKQSYTHRTPQMAQGLKKTKFCPILANLFFCCCKFMYFLKHFYWAK